MLYQFSDNIPAGTKKNDNRKFQVNIGRGAITQVAWRFMPGAEDTAHLVILHGTRQVIPLGEAESLTGNGEYNVFPIRYNINSRPYRLTFWTWNDDPNNDHAVVAHFNVIPFKYLYNESVLIRELRLLRKALAEWFTIPEEEEA
jgi:hypothetical protein